jgi:flagellar hook-associated protein 2
MAGITATGIGSNIDVAGLVDKLMQVEKQPLTALDKKEAAVQVKISALASFRGSLSTFQATLVGLEQTSSYTAAKVSLGDNSVASASSSADADPGTHSLEVTHLAAAQRLKSNTSFAAITDTVGTGTLSIQYGSYANGFSVNADRPTQTVTIDAAHSSLSGVRDAINAAKINVTASIVNDGTGYRLVLASKDTGSANGVRISVSDDDNTATDTAGLSRLAYDPAADVGSGKNMTEVVAAQDSAFLVDGIAITKPSNTVSDVLAGTTLTLLKTNLNTPMTLAITQDTGPVQTSVAAFVKAYNDVNKTITDLTKYNAETKAGGPLLGDAAVRSLAEQLRDSLSSVVGGVSGSYHALAQVGVTLGRDGNLSVDSGKLQTALQTNPQAVRSLFATSGYSDDSLVQYTGSTSTTPAGVYDLNVTQLATQGKIVGSAAAALTIDSSNDALTVAVNGVTTSITLNHATYANANALAAELQSKLNGSSPLAAAGILTSITASSGALSITSNRYGSVSKIALAGGNAQSALFGTSPTATDGLDVAGTLGGVTGVADGQKLTHPNGLSIQVSGGSTGARGKVSFGHGIAVQLDTLLGKALGTKGVLSERTDGLNQSVKQIGHDRDQVNAGLVVKQARYQKQFNTLDGLISSMQSTMTYLAQQLNSISR